MSESASASQALVQLSYRHAPRWIPSRFNARAVGDDGRLILWNTLSGAISVFDARHHDKVLDNLTPGGSCDAGDAVADHLRRRGFVVASDADELARFRYHYGRQQWRSDTLELTLLVTEECNFRCLYCYEKFEHGTMRREVRDGIRVYLENRAPQLKYLSVAWFGGEPLLGWDALAELGPFCQELADRHGIAHTQSITTNGYLLDDARADALLAWGCRRFQITVDGLAEDHDCKRKTVAGGPTYEVILANLRSLHRRTEDCRIVVRVNIDRKNAVNLGSFVETLADEFQDDDRFTLRFKTIGRWGGDQDDDLDVCGRRDGRQIIHHLQDIALRCGIRVEGGVTQHAAPGGQVCYAARPYHFVVSATGKLMKCTVALGEMEENVVGQVQPNGEWQIRDDRMARWVNPFFESDAVCKRCHLLPTCQGAACPLVRLETGHRCCCTTRSELKHELRMTLRQAQHAKAHQHGGNDG